MDAEILQQLILIKGLLVAVLTIFLACLGVAAWMMISLSRATRDMKSPPAFHTAAQELMEKGLYKEARTLTEDRFESHPGDAYAYWYHGRACEQLGELTTALESLRKADALNPGWTDEYIAPLVATIKARMREGEHSDPRD